MKRVTAWLLSSLFAVSLVAQDGPAKPGPEHARMAMGTGKWKTESVIYESPFGPAGKMVMKSESRPILGGLFYETRGQGKGPKGPYAFVEIISYDAEKKYFQSSWFDSDGYFDRPWKNQNATATIDGNTWTWTWKEERDGKEYHRRQVWAFSPDKKTATGLSTYSEDGVTWKKVGEDKSTKTGNLKPK